VGYNPNIPHLQVGYNPVTNHLPTSWDIQVPIDETGIGWTYYRYPHVASSAWLGLALLQKPTEDSPVSWTFWWWQLKHFLFLTLPGEMIQFDEHIFQMGWFNHQL